jgi:adenylate kinase
LNNLIFIGGIHGAGKGTICNKICAQTDFAHITASEILRWNEISKPDNKKVENIQDTQDRLISGIDKALKKNGSYLLDGHFCLFNSEGQVEKVPMETFKKIAPKLIAVVTTDVELIKQRLEKRDSQTYDFDTLKLMQDTERKYAEEVASIVNTAFIEIKNGNYNRFISLITNLN